MSFLIKIKKSILTGDLLEVLSLMAILHSAPLVKEWLRRLVLIVLLKEFCHG